MKWFNIDWLGKKVRVAAIKSQGKLWFHWQGQTQVLDLASEGRRGSSTSSKTQVGVIAAPMPGKITKVFVRLGEPVTSGKTLIVMEAMKMEYSLEADLAGVINELNCKLGDQVNLNQVLARIGESHV